MRMPHGGTLARRGGRPETPGVLAGDQRVSCDHALLVRLLADMRLKRCRNKVKNRLPKGTPAALRARPPGCLPAAALAPPARVAETCEPGAAVRLLAGPARAGDLARNVRHHAATAGSRAGLPAFHEA